MDEPIGLLARAQLQQQFTRTKLKVEKLQVLHEIGSAITSALDLEEMLTRIVDAAVYVTQADQGSLLLLNEGTRDLELRAQRGMGESHASGFRIPTADSIAGEVVQTNKPQRLTSPEEELKVVTGYLVKSILYVPVAIKEKVIGVLVVDNQAPDQPFSADDENLLQILAGYAAIALDNARLREELSEQAASGAVPTAADGVHLWLETDPALPQAQASGPEFVSQTIAPYVGALADLQAILDELHGTPHHEACILSIQPGLPASVTMEGVNDAVQIVQDVVDPWKRARAALLAAVAEKEGEAAIETAWVGILEARARASNEQDEREKTLAQVEQQRVQAARREAEGRPLRADVQWSVLQLASDVLARAAPDLAEGERLLRMVWLRPVLEAIVSNPLVLSTHP
jgi:putative methionine-R-sulfoxide reductase with GAF domain